MFSRLLTRNEHMIDRTLRVVAGIGLISLAFVGPQTPWGFVGIVSPVGSEPSNGW